MAEPMPKKGGGLLAMLAPKGDDSIDTTSMESEPEGAEGGDDDLAMIGADVMEALKGKDPEAFTESLKAFVSMC